MGFGKTMKAEVSAPLYCLLFLLILQSSALIGAQAPYPAPAADDGDDGDYPVIPVLPPPLAAPAGSQTVFSPPAPPTESGAGGPVTGSQTSSSTSKDGKHGLSAAAKGGISFAVILGFIVGCTILYVKRVRGENMRRQQQSHMQPIR